MSDVEKVERLITNDSEILDKLKEIIKPYLGVKMELENLTGKESLVEDLRINSAHIVDIIIDIESAFDILIEDESINNMNSVNDSIGVIKKQIGH